MVHPYIDGQSQLYCGESSQAEYSMQVLWGIVCALFATVKTAAGLLAIRFFLGVAEAGFLPGIVYWRKSL